MFQIISLFSATHLGNDIIWALFYQALFATAASFYHNTNFILPDCAFPRIWQIWPVLCKDREWRFPKKIRSNCERSLHSSCLFPPLCSPSLEGKSQQIYPDPLRFCFRLFLFISAATWIQSFLLMIIMYGVKGNREKAALRNRLLRASINICLKRTEEKGKDKYTK